MVFTVNVVNHIFIKGGYLQYQYKYWWLSFTPGIIAVGGGPSGPSIEGPFCRAVHLCRALGDRKIEKKSKKKQKNNEKRRKNWKKKRKKWVKKGKLQRFCVFSMHFSLFRVILCSSDSSFCRAARLCRALEGRWRPATSHWATAMMPVISSAVSLLFLSNSAVPRQFFLAIRE